MKYVYLAGPISGVSYDGCTDWRNRVGEALYAQGVEVLTPMRGKEFLKGNPSIQSTAEWSQAIASNKGIMRRDHFDATRATCLFVNLLGAKKVSIGTVMELAWAYHKHIPTIVVMEKDNLHRHPMLDESCSYIVNTLEEGVSLAAYLLNVTPRSQLEAA